LAVFGNFSSFAVLAKLAACGIISRLAIRAGNGSWLPLIALLSCYAVDTNIVLVTNATRCRLIRALHLPNGAIHTLPCSCLSCRASLALFTSTAGCLANSPITAFSIGRILIAVARLFSRKTNAAKCGTCGRIEAVWALVTSVVVSRYGRVRQ